MYKKKKLTLLLTKKKINKHPKGIDSPKKKKMLKFFYGKIKDNWWQKDPWTVPPQPASYSATTSKAMMGQVSKEGSIMIQVKGLDAIPAAIYRKEDPLEKWIER